MWVDAPGALSGFWGVFVLTTDYGALKQLYAH